MELAELTAYAAGTYQMAEQHKWADFPGFSVLCHPQTGKWVALLMRQWDPDRGEELQRCDIRCGAEALLQHPAPYLSLPTRMRGGQWLGVIFDARTEPEVVFHLLDRAVALGRPHGYTLVLDNHTAAGGYRDTALPFAGSSYRPPREQLPEQLRRLRRMFVYGRVSDETRAKNFRRQAEFMQDYTDDVPWTGDFSCYFPTYQDLSTTQLRGYFTWRTRLRQGQAQPIPASAAYIYIYELLNCVGAASAEDALQKLLEFEALFLDSGIGEASIRPNLRRWMLEFSVLHALPPALARQAADPALLARDEALGVLQAPEAHTEDEIFAALLHFGAKKLERTPVLAGDPDRGRRLFAQIWRACAKDLQQGQDLFTRCFGPMRRARWYPLVNAVVYDPARPEDRDYALGPCRSYRRRGGLWETAYFDPKAFDRSLFSGLLHAADARLRRYLKTGRYLREKPEDAWAGPYIDAVLAADRRAALEAARPRITIDLSGLEQIRRDAAATRESLLTADEIEEIEALEAAPAPEAVPAPEAAPAPEPVQGPAPERSDLPLDAVQLQILRTLLAGQDPGPLIRANHLMPSIVADAVNEALFDEIGDTVLLCEDDRLLLVDDYIEDLIQILGGTSHGGT